MSWWRWCWGWAEGRIFGHKMGSHKLYRVCQIHIANLSARDKKPCSVRGYWTGCQHTCTYTISPISTEGCGRSRRWPFCGPAGDKSRFGIRRFPMVCVIAIAPQLYIFNGITKNPEIVIYRWCYCNYRRYPKRVTTTCACSIYNRSLPGYSYHTHYMKLFVHACGFKDTSRQHHIFFKTEYDPCSPTTCMHVWK